MSSDTTSPGNRRHDHGSQLAELSNAMVRLYKDHFGRGPTSTRSMWAGPDTLVCLLEDTLTPPERLLQQMGEHERLRDMRTFFQYSKEDVFRHEVERIFGRKVRAFLSSFDARSGIAGEVFLLEPSNEENLAPAP